MKEKTRVGGRRQRVISAPAKKYTPEEISALAVRARESVARFRSVCAALNAALAEAERILLERYGPEAIAGTALADGELWFIRGQLVFLRRGKKREKTPLRSAPIGIRTLSVHVLKRLKDQLDTDVRPS